MKNERQQGQDNADHGKNLGDVRRVVCQTTKAENGRDDRDDEEDNGPLEHDNSRYVRGWGSSSIIVTTDKMWR